MYGLGIAKGMWVTLQHFVDTYVQDAQYLFRSAKYRSSRLPERQGPKTARGLFTVEYPREKLQMTENYRNIPFLVYNSTTGQERCTSCGICAKVCPPQCIWIVRSNDPVSGRPIPEPTEFFIDIDICMNCGLCAEYCPFDAIKMDHDYELASFERMDHHIFNKEKLSKPASYYASIRPRNNAAEEGARAAKEAAKEAKAESA